MSTPTFNQSRRILDFFDEVGASKEQIQTWLGAGDLTKLMLAADLPNVDREAFKALLAPLPKSIDWTPVAEYRTKLRDWNEPFNLGLLEAQIDSLELPDHAGPHLPTSINLTLGKGLLNDRQVVQRIIAYEMRQIRRKYTDYIGNNGWSVAYYPGCEPTTINPEPQLAPALLDIGRFWDPKDGVTIPGVRNELAAASEPMPALEVDWLMAFNPQVLAAIDGKTIPGFIAPGLVVDSDDAPGFGRDGVGAYARDCWDGDRWSGCSVVAFRRVQN